MNLFVTDEHPLKAACHLDDIRLNKMITESCQMIVLALAKNGLPASELPLTKAGTPYKTKGHANHPVTLWTGRISGNFLWHVNYLKSALTEYEYRYEKTRTGMNIVDLACKWLALIPEGNLEPFQNSSEYKETIAQDVIYCYRQTMLDKWHRDKIKVKWTKRMPPEWSPLSTVLRDGVYIKFTAKDQKAFEDSLLG